MDRETELLWLEGAKKASERLTALYLQGQAEILADLGALNTESTDPWWAMQDADDTAGYSPVAAADEACDLETPF